MDYVRNKNVSMINEHTTCFIWEKEPKDDKKNEMHCWRQIIANMIRSMVVSWFIHVKISYHIRICGLFGATSSVEITMKWVGRCTLGYTSKRDVFVRSKPKVIWKKKRNREKPLSRLDELHAPHFNKFSAFGVYKKFLFKYTFSWHKFVRNVQTYPPLMIICSNLDYFNSLWPSYAIWWHRTGATLPQAMACSPAAPSHYLNQCWLIISNVQRHLSEGNFATYSSVINH